MTRSHLIAILSVALAASCTTKQKAEITDEAMKDPERRREILEATLRVLDANPEYTDEMFQLARRHKAFDRLLGNTAASVKDPELAQRVARQLVAYPDGLRTVMAETLEAAQNKPDAQLAIVEAMERRADIAAAYLVEHPKQLAEVSKALVRKAADHPDTAGQLKDVLKDMITD